MNLQAGHLLGIGVTLLSIVALGIWSGRQVKSAADFSTGGGRAGLAMFSGSMLGTLAGGACTIGTSQLGFTNGFSAIWFTAGLGAGCVFFALFYVRRLRHSGHVTLQQVIAAEYGPTAGFIASVLGILSIMLSVISQLLSAVALLGTLLPFSVLGCALLATGLILAYVLFGGLLSAGRIGIVKTVLITLASIGGGLLALTLAGGPSALGAALPAGSSFGLFSRGLTVDGGAAVSSVLGFLSTQTYVQCILSARSDRIAMQGSLIAALVVPPIGVGSVLVGLYMRTQRPDLDPGQAFPAFVLQSLPPVLGGVVLATLLLAIVGASSGLMLGVSTIVASDLYPRVRPRAGDRERLALSRGTIVAGLLVALVFVCTLKGTILHWSFFSMALRSSLTFLPLTTALFLPGKIDRRFALVTVVVGPLVALAASMTPAITCDPVFPGLLAAALPLVAGYRHKRHTGA